MWSAWAHTERCRYASTPPVSRSAIGYKRLNTSKNHFSDQVPTIMENDSEPVKVQAWGNYKHIEPIDSHYSKINEKIAHYGENSRLVI